MALSDNQIIELKKTPARLTLKLVNGLIRVYKGAFLNYEAANIGYAKLGADALSEEFAGIALEEKNLAAADNVTDGDNDVEVISRGSGDLILMVITTTITIANEGDPVYVDGDDAVDIASGILNTTGGFVGIIRQFVGANSAWVQMTQHPAL